MPRLFPILLLICSPFSATAGEPISFRNEVMAVLARGGCNQGACHANLNGKGGFRLSLRGEDPSSDHQTLTREQFGRRLSIADPDESLILRKGAGLVPHEGGVRFAVPSPEYRLLRRWIAAGAKDDGAVAPKLVRLTVTPQRQILFAPTDRVDLRATATFADGSTKDVTELAVYESTVPGVLDAQPSGLVKAIQPGQGVILVRYLDQQVPVSLAFVPARDDFVWTDVPLKDPVDRIIFAHLKELRLTPSPLADDAMFLRRAYLDAIGKLPTPMEVRAFLKDNVPEKRDRLIEKLVRRPEFADYWALKWADLLRNEEKALDRKGVRVFHRWIRDAIASDMPMNDFARELVMGRGSTYEVPAANFYRSLREPYARAEAAAQVFLGIRIACAKCHNHPFDRWTQTDYHEFAALFAQVDYRIISNDRRDRFDQHEFAGEQIVFANPNLQLNDPRTKAPLAGRLLGSKERPATSDRLAALGEWLAEPNNPFFAKAQVNRVWYHLFGRGLVEPNDDFRAANPPTIPGVLEELEDGFRANKFSLRSLVERLLKTRTYQLSSYPAGTNRDDELNFSKAALIPLQAEQLLGAVTQVLAVPVRFKGYPLGTNPLELAAPFKQGGRGSGKPEEFLRTFGKPERLLSCDCERSTETGLMQAFQLLTGELFLDLLRRPENRIGRLLKAGKTDVEIISELYLAALTRQPTSQELRKLAEAVRRAPDRRRGLEDVAWAILNAKEFLLRR